MAHAAWKDDVKSRFSKLETVDWAHADIRGWTIPLPFHPNIDSASRFTTLLQEAARQEPVRVANLVVKALHDFLNETGVEVTNRVGDAWALPGDGTLMVGTGKLTPADLTRNLTIIRKAVQQSVDDINSPTIRASNLDFQKYFDGVWQYVPEPTAAARQRLTTLIHDYTDPNSSTLVDAAVKVITEQLDEMIDVLESEKKLKAA